MKIAIGCDPNAEQEKEDLIAYIKEKKYGEVEDFGSEDPIYGQTPLLPLPASPKAPSAPLPLLSPQKLKTAFAGAPFMGKLRYLRFRLCRKLRPLRCPSSPHKS